MTTDHPDTHLTFTPLPGTPDLWACSRCGGPVVAGKATERDHMKWHREVDYLGELATSMVAAGALPASPGGALPPLAESVRYQQSPWAHVTFSPVVLGEDVAAGITRCSAGGCLVMAGDEATHRVRHYVEAETCRRVDELTLRLAELERPRDRSPRRVATDGLLDSLLADWPGEGRVRVAMYGDDGDVAAVLESLGMLMDLGRVDSVPASPTSSISRRAFTLDITTMAAGVDEADRRMRAEVESFAAGQFAAAAAGFVRGERIEAEVDDLRRPRERIPGGHIIDRQAATDIARHSKAALLHLGVVMRTAAEAGEPVEGNSELAAFMREALDWAGALDTWASSTAHRSEVPRTIYVGAADWCASPGRTLPTGALEPAPYDLIAGDRPANDEAPTEAPAEASAEGETPAGGETPARENDPV